VLGALALASERTTDVDLYLAIGHHSLRAMMGPSLAIQRLSSDPLRHVVTLKMLSLFGPHVQLELFDNGAGWATKAIFPAAVSGYDRRWYPTADFIVLVDGNSPDCMVRILDDLPRSELLLKISNRAAAQHATDLLGGQLQRTFISFTAARAGEVAPHDVMHGCELHDEMTLSFIDAGYGRDELDACFRRGGRWFAKAKGARPSSACFVYENFGKVWEIAGVFTQPDLRRQGLARRVVAAATRHLLENNLQPRYQVDAKNVASIGLARSLEFEEFLRVEHVRVPAIGRAT
jgi:GNAT superfamily N-acetyltransferase